MSLHNAIRVVSETFPEGELLKILNTECVFHPDGHFLYPADGDGAHLLSFFNIEPIAKDEDLISSIVRDIIRWVERENIVFDVVFCPDQPGVTDIAEEIAWALDARVAFWEYDTETGRFGNELVFGELLPGDEVLVFNGVTQQGRCVGQRLPEFAEELGGEVVAAAVFAKGTTGLVRQTEERFGSSFYSAIQVDIPVYSPDECPLCLGGDADSLRPWTSILCGS